MANITDVHVVTLRFPSAVSRIRLHPPQKFSLMDVIKPTWPLNPGTLYACKNSLFSLLVYWTGILYHIQEFSPLTLHTISYNDNYVWHKEKTGAAGLVILIMKPSLIALSQNINHKTLPHSGITWNFFYNNLLRGWPTYERYNNLKGTLYFDLCLRSFQAMESAVKQFRCDFWYDFWFEAALTWHLLWLLILSITDRTSDLKQHCPDFRFETSLTWLLIWSSMDMTSDLKLHGHGLTRACTLNVQGTSGRNIIEKKNPKKKILWRWYTVMKCELEVHAPH